ncbi:sensor histidine kinase [Leptolyngbya sp. AN03gr2]|uniref:sensor histidine kinase n=1 Tax=unclassified Leptolyngbya TaxID=2650499 RepID=UPI003D322AF8
MAGLLQSLYALFRSRLSQRIVLWVFISILVAEILLLIVSLNLRQQELLGQLRTITIDKAVELVRTIDSADFKIEQIQKLSVDSHIIGGVLYQADGTMIRQFGEAPQLLFKNYQQNTIDIYSPIEARYDEAIALKASNNVLILRHDVTSVRYEMLHTSQQFAGTVFLIGAFVTIATMIGLERILITPILTLRSDLLKAGTAIAQDQESPEFEVVQLQRQDELGEVIAAFFQMHQNVMQAISTRKQAEQTMTRLAEIGELTAMIVHEIRNPLTTIFLELRDLQQLDRSETTQARLAIVLEEAERLKKLLNEILLYSKSQRLKLAQLEINQWIEEIFPLIEPIPLRQGQSLKFIPAASSCMILGDSNRLKQVMINLISNASEAIEPGDQITCSVIPSPSYVCIQVHNRGQPIPPDELSKLTQPFYTTKPCGTGLGLAIVKRIIEAHNGELKIQSDAISGTTITIHLPQFKQTQAES